MVGKLRQGREIDLRRLFQPRLICFPVGVQYADSAETRRLGGFQGVDPLPQKVVDTNPNLEQNPNYQ